MSTPSTEDAVVDLIRRRGEAGREKYGTSMDRRDLSPAQWLQHFQEELADGLQYAERFKGACALLEEAAHIIGRAAVDSGRGLQWLADYKAQFGEQPGQDRELRPSAETALFCALGELAESIQAVCEPLFTDSDGGAMWISMRRREGAKESVERLKSALRSASALLVPNSSQ